MNIDLIKLVTFSPTGNSRKIGEAIAKGIQAPIQYIDLTPPLALTKDFDEFHDELAIIVSPVYVGRLPYETVTRLRRMIANNTPAALAVTYGNRAYEDALLELSDIATEVGFKPIAACAFIGKHSWSIPKKPVAEGRPDDEDLAQAEMFGNEIKEKLKGIDDIGDVPSVEVPGSRPYTLSRDARPTARRFDPGKPFGPVTNEEICNKCGKCEKACPTAAVTLENVVSNPSPTTGFNVRLVSTNESACIWCCACVRSCPTGARVMRARMLETTEWLYTNHSERKKSETFL